MFGFGKKKNTDAPAQEAIKEPKVSFFGRLKKQLSKTRNGLTGGLGNLFLGKKQIDDDLFEELEMLSTHHRQFNSASWKKTIIRPTSSHRCIARGNAVDSWA